MSSRQLRKLQQQRELDRAPEEELSSDDEPYIGETVKGPQKPNLFAALGADENEDSGSDDQAQADEDKEHVAEPEPEPEPELEAVKKSKKKKKNKKAKKTTPPETETQPTGDDEDEIDMAVKALNLDESTRPAGTASSSADSAALKRKMRFNEVLSINPYHLRAVNEMRNLFGKDVMDSANAEEQAETQGRRRRQQLPRQVDLETFLREPPGAKKLPEVSLRRNVFVQGREHWPRQSAGGLTMEVIDKAADGGSCTEYAYVHDKDYDAMQAMFFACVQIGDPMRMVHLLKRGPYHVSTLLQVSSVAKQDQNMALASELCERALFTFGRVTTSAFRQDLEHGRARLDFRRPENRQFWLAGYHYLKSLIRKGTYRTALEWTKLLFALDHKDPYAMRHYLHVMALRAYQSQWLLEYFDHLDNQPTAADTMHPDLIYLRQSLVLAKLLAGDINGASKLLIQGVISVPWLYCALFQELNLDAPPAIWGVSPESDAETFWVKLYIYQAKDLWNNAAATGLLVDVVKSIAKEDVQDRLAKGRPSIPVDLGAARLVYLEGQTGLLAVAPREFLERQPNYEFDPLPPAEDENIFTGEGAQLPWREREQAGQGQANELMARMQNLLARQAGGRGAAAAAAAVAAGAAPGGPGAGAIWGGGDNDEDEDDAEVQALRAADDEELLRDIEAHMRGGDGQGVLARLMGMFGMGSGSASLDDGDQGDGNAGEAPGAWPSDDEEFAETHDTHQ